MNEPITLKRDELYNLVWKEPIIKIASRYGISDRGLTKICNKLNVPTPPRGYWAKLQHGIQVKRISLPKIKRDEPTTHTIYGYNKPNIVKDISKEAEELILTEQSAEKIIVPDRLISPHPLIKEARGILSKSKPDDYGMLRLSFKDGLDIRVTPNNLKRALMVLNSLFKALKSRGFIFNSGVTFSQCFF
ncbi:MAG: hypothetical protein K9L30_14610 [Desulfobacterales bacterium]|nr:hypothetical protein [Desulfobacterales bacterium]